LVGIAYFEVIGRKCILITIETGSRQGVPFLSILILMEPLSCFMTTAFLELIYTTEEWVLVGPMMYADDNLKPLAFTDASQLGIILTHYEVLESVDLA
jgi:hypothetical protein